MIALTPKHLKPKIKGIFVCVHHHQQFQLVPLIIHVFNPKNSSFSYYIRSKLNSNIDRLVRENLVKAKAVPISPKLQYKCYQLSVNW